ncbi:hypothetical protein RDWZM_002096 [Blomia tropicalis]|uniref:Uncharacterized protein n=1 Tax=Blomia tropicalis TaxID=40697 RepID=A0A9Q0RRA1_BLOTA|nr:hypothetical protein RDWZM_002096 [Blomia tropicalis]
MSSETGSVLNIDDIIKVSQQKLLKICKEMSYSKQRIQDELNKLSKLNEEKIIEVVQLHESISESYHTDKIFNLLLNQLEKTRNENRQKEEKLSEYEKEIVSLKSELAIAKSANGKKCSKCSFSNNTQPSLAIKIEDDFVITSKSNLVNMDQNGSQSFHTIPPN